MVRGDSVRTALRGGNLVGAITDVFLTEGFAGLDMDRLALRIGVPVAELSVLAAGWDDLVEHVVSEFLRNAALRVELRAAALSRPRDRLIAYLDALSVELSVVDERFYRDLETCEAGLAIYRTHTQRAAIRVQALVGEGISAGEFRAVSSRFVGAILMSVLTSVQRGEMEATACLGQSRTYSLLTDLVLRGIDAPRD